MAGGTAKAATVRSDNIVPGLYKRRDDLAPGVGELREAMEEDDDEGPVSGGGIVGFKDVHGKGIVGDGMGNGSRGYYGVHGVYVFRGKWDGGF